MVLSCISREFRLFYYVPIHIELPGLHPTVLNELQMISYSKLNETQTSYPNKKVCLEFRIHLLVPVYSRECNLKICFDSLVEHVDVT